MCCSLLTLSSVSTDYLLKGKLQLLLNIYLLGTFLEPFDGKHLQVIACILINKFIHENPELASIPAAVMYMYLCMYRGTLSQDT